LGELRQGNQEQQRPHRDGFSQFHGSIPLFVCFSNFPFLQKCIPDIIFRPKHLTLRAGYAIMAGVIKRLFRPEEEIMLDRRIMELQTAKEILAEVFGIRLQDVDEMIQNRFEAASPEDICVEEDGLWPQEFRL